MSELIRDVDFFLRAFTASLLIGVVVAGRIVASIYCFHKWIARLNAARDVAITGVASALVVNVMSDTPVTPGLYALLIFAVPTFAVSVLAAVVVVQSRMKSREPHKHSHGF